MSANTFPLRSAIGTVLVRTRDRIVLWTVSAGFTLVLTLIGSILARVRMSHNNGVAASGRVRILDDPNRPEHPFFRPGTIMPCRIRHACASFMDDAMRVVRAMSVKFADEPFKSPFDIELNTGRVALFWSAASFLRFAKYKRTKYGIQYHEYYQKYPAGVRGAKNGMRRNPTSYTNLHYYSQTPLYWVGSDQVTRYAKYRAIPADGAPETGRLKGPDLEDPSENQRILPGEERTRNYLKEEYEARIAREPAVYTLQVQLHTASDDDSPEVFNCCQEWEEDSHPWYDLAEITVDRTLSWKDACMTAFSLGNLPKSLGVLPATSILDYNSLNYMRRHSEMARRARTLMYKLFGPPPEIPDDDNRNV